MNNKYLKAYKYYISVEKNLNKKTIGNYTKELMAFFSFLETHHNKNIEKDMVNISEDTDYIKSYLFYLVNEKKNSKKTINWKITTLRNFFHYIAAIKEFPEIKTSPMLLIKNQKTEKKLPTYLTLAECEKLLYSIKFFSTYCVRDYAIFQTFLSTGARLSEITQLTLNQVDLTTGIIRIYGKGDKEREVGMTDEALAALKKYINNGIVMKTKKVAGRKIKVEDISKRGRAPKVDTDIVFLNKYGMPFTEKGIYALLKTIVKKAEINKNGLSPHKLRHSYATLLLHNGLDLKSLQELLGHASIRTTELYTHTSAEAISKAKQLHPLNRSSIDDELVEKIKTMKNE